jgi:hypothetical protein
MALQAMSSMISGSKIDYFKIAPRVEFKRKLVDASPGKLFKTSKRVPISNNRKHGPLHTSTF